ncbi:hypothetical protein A5481_28555 [Methylobacterium platani]|uniref:CobW/HypB/UreG nucleotide-binding domain-containing protein n=2 Tax=Methylobacterium platani TaxID=427683 RepID=A0A179S223_9HYPH|nr:hypothetical protein A5481_28555 [Methylobacterium platani]
MVTVVDAVNLMKDYDSRDFPRDRGETAREEDARTLVDLLVEQIEFADVVVVNKADDVTDEERVRVIQVVRGLNADACIVPASHSRLALAEVLETGLYRDERSQTHPLWYRELFDFAKHVPETEEYGIRSFVFRARRPFTRASSTISSSAASRA